MIGKRIFNVNGYAKATGLGKYNFDLELPQQLYGKIKRSPYPHGKIISIDVSKAEELPGVRAVITGHDAIARSGTGICDEWTLAKDRVRFVGDGVAAVAADSEEIAEEAIDLIEIEYEELEPLFDPEESIKKKPPVIIHEELPSYKLLASSIMPQLDKERPNVFNFIKVRRGELEKAFQDADLVIENRFRVSMIQHCQMEPHNAIARVEHDGSVTIWSSHSAPYKLRMEVCEGLQLPESKVRTIVPSYIGGSYGGKGTMKTELICALLAMKTKMPVRIFHTREELISCDTARAPFIVDIKTGVKKDGTLVAQKVEYILAGGGYAGTGFLTARNAAYGPCAQYRIPNFKLDGYGTYTNTRVVGAFRGFGNSETIWGIETQMDIIAEELRMDPVEFRMKNMLEEGDFNAFGEKMHSVGAKECLRKVAEAIEWGKKPESGHRHIRRGKGIAVGNKYSLVPTASASIVKIREDEMIELRCSVVDIGQGSNTIFSQIVAEELRIPVERVIMPHPDTLITPYDQFTGSSRATFGMGNAIRLACADLKRQLFDLASPELEANPDDLETAAFKVYVKGSPEKSIKIRDLFIPMVLSGRVLPQIGELLGKATYYLPGVMPDPETGQSERAAAFYIFTAQAAEVEVDIETGKIKVSKFVTACDCGRAINPMNVEGQIEGGALSMGIGSALMEEIVMDNGQVLNPTFVDYKIPTSTDVPTLENTKSIIVEEPHREGPFGAKGVGEGVLICSAPAIGNAIYDAIGIRFKEIPITPEKVLWALKGKS